MADGWEALPIQIVASFFGFSAITAGFFRQRTNNKLRQYILGSSLFVCLLLWFDINIKAAYCLTLSWNTALFTFAWFFSIIPIALFWIGVGITSPPEVTDREMFEADL